MKKKNVEIINDFGKWHIADKWEDVKLDQFVKLMKLNENGVTDIRDVIAILSNRSMEEVNLLPYDFCESMMARLTFLNEQPKYEADNKIVIGDDLYLINFIEKLKFGEYVDVNSTIQSDNMNYAAFLGILCRKEGEIYNDDFIANTLDERIEMYNNQPITKILPLIAFFLNLYQASEIYSQDSMMELKQAADQLLQQTKHSVKNGGYKKFSLIWRMKTLMKLRKYSKLISQL